MPYSLCGFQRVDALSEKLPQMFDEAAENLVFLLGAAVAGLGCFRLPMETQVLFLLGFLILFCWSSFFFVLLLLLFCSVPSSSSSFFFCGGGWDFPRRVSLGNERRSL